MTSSGRFIEASRLASCCSEPPLLSPASLIRKPLFAVAYIATTWADTFHSRQPAVAPAPRPDMVVIGSPVVCGWLSHVTPPSLQPAPMRQASRTRSVISEFRCRRSVADSTAQPAGTAGRLKRTSERALLAGPLEMTLIVGSPPLLVIGAAWSIHASALAPSVCCAPQLT